MGTKHRDFKPGIDDGTPGVGIHSVPAIIYADTAARDADTDFNTDPLNVDKMVRVGDSYSILLSITPTWFDFEGAQDETLAQTLASGNVSGGNNLIMSAGDAISVGGSAPATDTSIDLQDTDKAFLFNRLTTPQRDALTPLAGMSIWNNTNVRGEMFNGTIWETMIVGTPGIDDVLNVGQVIGTTGRTIQIENSFDLTISAFDTNPSSFLTRAFQVIEGDAIRFGAGTGDGAGGFLDESQFEISPAGMIITDGINTKGLQYDADYSANATDRTLIDKEYSDFKSYLAQNVQSSGIVTGMLPTAASATTVDISSGTGFIADYSTQDDPTTTQVTFTGVTGLTPTNIGTPGTFVFAVNSAGTLSEIPAASINSTTVRDFVLLGAYNTNGAIILLVLTEPLNIGFNGIEGLKDFIRDVIGPSNINGNIIGPNGANLNLDNTGGTTYIVAQGFRTTPEIPDEKVVSTAVAFAFLPSIRDNVGPDIITMAPTITVDPGNYDDGSGVLASVAANDWTVQVFYITPSATYGQAYGQEIFNQKQDAIDALQLGTLNFEERPTITKLVRRTFLVVKGNATDLSNTAQAEFFDDGKFRGGGTSTSGGIPGINIPGGSDTNIQFNDAGAFGGDSDLTWNKTTNILGITGDLNVSGLINDAKVGMVGSSFFLNDDSIPSDVGFSVVIGNSAGENLSTGAGTVTLIGAGSGLSITTGSSHAACGNGTLRAITTSVNDVALGVDAARNMTAGNDGVFIGNKSAFNLLTGNNGIYIGSGSVPTLTSGNSNIVIGKDADVPAASTSDFLNIGGAIFGDLSSGSIRIGGSGLVTGPEILNIQGDTVSTGTFNEVDLGRETTNIFFNSDGPAVGAWTRNTVMGSDAGSTLGAADGNTLIGSKTGQSITTGSLNTLIGADAGEFLTTGARNIAIGSESLNTTTNAEDNVAVGHRALFSNPGGPTRNTAIGSFAGEDLIGFNNVFIGFNAGVNATSADRNVLIGSSVVDGAILTGDDNILIGHDLNIPTANTSDYISIGDLIFGDSNTKRVRIGGSGVVSGPESLNVQGDTVVNGLITCTTLGVLGNAIINSNNLGAITSGTTLFFNGTLIPDACGLSAFFGDQAGDSLTTGTNNSGFGREALRDLTNGQHNTTMGVRSLTTITQGDDNTAIGSFAFDALGTGVNNGNTALGRQAAFLLASGNNGVYLGKGTAPTLTSGSNNIIIGQGAGVPAASTSNFLNIGGLIFGDFNLSQVKIVDPSDPTPPAFSGEACLELASTSKALLLNRLGNTEENNLTKVDGMFWYNTSSNKYKGRENGVTVTFTTS